MQKLAALFPGRVLLADYSLRVVESDPYEKVLGEPRVRIHRTSALDWTRDQILMGAEGGDVWPALPLQEELELKAHLTASVRQLTEDKHGQAVAQWVETGPDHLRHAHTYYTVAAALAGGRTMWQSHLRKTAPRGCGHADRRGDRDHRPSCSRQARPRPGVLARAQARGCGERVRTMATDPHGQRRCRLRRVRARAYRCRRMRCGRLSLTLPELGHHSMVALLPGHGAQHSPHGAAAGGGAAAQAATAQAR